MIGYRMNRNLYIKDATQFMEKNETSFQVVSSAESVMLSLLFSNA